MSDLAARLLEAGRRAEASAGSCPYPVGCRVRVLSRVIEDGQTGKWWAGATGTVMGAFVAPGRSFWRVDVAHENGRDRAIFNEDEIDRRFGPRVRAAVGGGG